jgi:hypothetical protein
VGAFLPLSPVQAPFWAGLFVTESQRVRIVDVISIIAGQTKGLEQRNKEDFDASASLTIPSTPQPASLGALAMGAPGLSIWRRESVGATR